MKLRDSNGEANHTVPWSNGALRPPHPKQIGPAHAYFLKLEDMVTTGDGTDGLVFGGKPISDEEIAQSLGLHPNTVSRHRARLARYGYIALKRAPNGYIIRVAKSKKWELIQGRRSSQKPRKSDPQDVVDHLKSDPPKTVSDPPKMVNDPQGLVDADQTVVGLTQDVVGTAATSEKNLWNEIGLDFPVGTPDFQSAWRFYFLHRDGQPLSEAMERCIQNRQGKRLSVPKPFFTAKRAVELRESAEPSTGPEPIHTLTSEEIPA